MVLLVMYLTSTSPSQKEHTAQHRAAHSSQGRGNFSPTCALGPTLSMSVTISETVNEALHSLHDTVVEVAPHELLNSRWSPREDMRNAEE